MTISNNHHSVSRRAALAGLSAAGAGLALAAAGTHVAAKATTGDMAAHPIVGLWQLDPGPNSPTGSKFDFFLVHSDGTYNEWGGLAVGVALGIWRPTGERTAELMHIYVDTDPTTKTETLGTATFRTKVQIDDTGNAYTADGDLDLRDDNGVPIVTLPAHWTAMRITFDHNPATGSTIPATPTAGTPTP
jgi:hypothetical protein